MKMHKKAGSFPLLIVLLPMSFLSCEPAASETEEINTSGLPEIELIHQFTISDSEDFFMQMITGITSDSKGRIYLKDGRAFKIYVLDPEGEYLTSIGGEGSGPGEFRSLLRFFTDPNDRLYVSDIREARTTIFSENENVWEPANLFLTEGERYSVVTADGEGRLILRQGIMNAPEPGVHWFTHELATGTLDKGVEEKKVITFRETANLINNDRMMVPLPFAPQTILATGKNGHLFMLWNEKFELARYNSRLELVDSLAISIPTQPVTQEEKDEIMNSFPGPFRSLLRDHLPERKPVVRNMHVDDNGNLWLQTYDSPEYLVIDPAGNPLGSFDLPGDLILQHVDKSRVYAMKMDDNGYQIRVFDYQL